ncbi:hypothetical protein BJ742DRAFT_833094 [Cladochytrium replicatum]|nr:hypothetical protein BJ742DRAFT_833094 [Cladochytrium replicatum]
MIASHTSFNYPNLGQLDGPLDSHRNENMAAEWEEASDSKTETSAADELLYNALKGLTTTTPAYRKTPLAETFNWGDVSRQLPIELAGVWYIVAFRSVRRADADHKALYDADFAAHEEAKNSGGILKYWYGDLDADRRCLAMCVWAGRGFARRATRKPKHLVAVGLAARMYDEYRLERYWLIKVAGSTEFRIEELTDNRHPVWKRN